LKFDIQRIFVDHANMQSDFENFQNPPKQFLRKFYNIKIKILNKVI